jgi:CubicO group peptidase (beta-lactamase class C family)
LLKAQELGKLNLDDPINKYLSFKVVNPYYPEEPITIRQLATHTSTIKDATQYERNGYVLREKNNEGAAVLRNFRPSNEMMGYNLFLEKILSNEGQWYKKRNFINNKPGRVFEYSNIGAGLAALVLENAVGKPFYEFSEIHIFEALGMSGTHWFIKDVDTLEHTNLYTDKNKVIAPYQLVNYPDGGLITSSHDLAKYLTELISGYSGKGKVLTNEGYLEFFKPNLNNVIHKDRNNGKYNDEFDMGIFMGISAQGQVGHTGGDPGVSTIMFFDSVSKTGKLLLTNTDLNKEGIQELIDIWNTLEAYEIKL